MTEPRWTQGATIALRYFPRGQLRWVKPVRVVGDSEAEIALFLAAGTIIKKPVHAENGREISRSLSYEERFAVEWALGDGVWENNSVLMLTKPGLAHAYWAFWNAATWEFLAWYVNLQAPLARTAIGFDSEDHVLDLVIEPDLSSWEWKDEHELSAAVRVGRFTEDDARSIRTEGEKAIKALEARAWPFERGWEHWRPDPSWTLPGIAPEWDTWPQSRA